MERLGLSILPTLPVAHSLPCVLAQETNRPVNSPTRTDGNGGHRSTAGDSTTHAQTDGLWRVVITPPVPTHLPVDEQVERIFRNARLVDCNDAMARMYGLSSAADLIGRPLNELLNPTVPENQEYLRAVVESISRRDHDRAKDVVCSLQPPIRRRARPAKFRHP